VPHEAKTVAILPLVRQKSLKWSHDKYATIHKRQGLRFEIEVLALAYSSHVADKNKYH